LWRAVDQNGMVLDILVQSRRDTQAAKRRLCKLLPPSDCCASCSRSGAGRRVS